MRRRSLTELLFAALVVAVVVAATVTYFATRSSQTSSGGVAADVARTIPSSGATLVAEVVTPKHSGKSPLIVMPAGWGGAATQYRPIARQFAASGYVVVAYAQRGFSGSTGEVDLAGSATQHDASTVIDWALAHTPADPARIGMMGMSYGAGVSLLAAAHDRRIRAVAALSTWSDVGKSFAPGDTPATGALSVLIGATKPTFRFDSTVKSLRQTLTTSPKSVGTATRAISKSRSPNSYVAQLNKNAPAVMLANAFEDSIFPPAQLVPFFDSLTTPKRLELAAGDHGGPELSSLYGQPNSTVDDARAWFDHFLRAQSNGIQTEPPILLRDAKTGVPHSYSTWPDAAAQKPVPLGAPGSTKQTGASAAATWRTSIHSGTDSGATSGPSRLVSSASYQPPQLLMSSIQAKDAFIWNGPVLLSDFAIIGTPAMHLLLGSSTGTATVFAYVYDVSAAGVGSLIDVQPFTATRLGTTTLRPVTITMQPIAWTVPRNDHVEVVIDTVDQRFQSLTPPGSTITVASSSAHPASFAASDRG